MVVETSYVVGWRPWFSLYGVRVQKSHAKKVDKQLGLIEEMLPDEVLVMIFKHLSPTNLGVAQCVCHQWRYAASTPFLWKTACLEAFKKPGEEFNIAEAVKPYKGNWKEMFLKKPHLRFDGIYVSRNTYIKTGVTEWRIRNPVHLVCYYRYIRVLPDGRFFYRTSPETISKVAKSLQYPFQNAHKPGSSRSQVQQGKYILDDNKMFTALRYENSTSTEIRSRMKLRSTCLGANNRLDIESIFSWDREVGVAVPMADIRADQDQGVEERSYTRGLSPYVFVPWEHVNSSQLNLPVSEMDVYIPG